jgi:hypothetical protein
MRAFVLSDFGVGICVYAVRTVWLWCVFWYVDSMCRGFLRTLLCFGFLKLKIGGAKLLHLISSHSSSSLSYRV